MSNTTANEATYRAVFRNRNYLNLWFGQTISQVGDAITIVALPLIIYQLTQSATSLTLAFIIEAIPWIVIGPLAGVFVDRLDRKKLLVATDVIRMLLVFSIFFVSNVYLLYLIAFLSQVAAATFAPARSAAIAELVPRDLYPKAIGLSYTSFQIVQMIGPFFAAGLITWFGSPQKAFLIDGLTFFLAAAATMFIKFPSREAKASDQAGSAPSFFESFREGVRFLFGHKALRFVMSVYLLKTIGMSCVLISALLYVKTVLQLDAVASDRLYSMVVATMAVGAFIGIWLIGFFDKKLDRRFLIIGGLMFEGLMYIGILFHPSQYALLALFLVAGFMQSGTITPISVSFAEYTTSEVRGRVYSVVNSLGRTSGVVGFGLAGLLSEAYGPVVTLTTVAGLFLIVTPLLTVALGGIAALRKDPPPVQTGQGSGAQA